MVGDPQIFLPLHICVTIHVQIVCMKCTQDIVKILCIYLLIACQPLTAPDNGDIDCSLGDDNVPTNRDSCTFTCDDGFRLRGSTGRNCRIRRGRAQWTGDETTCAGGTLLNI